MKRLISAFAALVVLGLLGCEEGGEKNMNARPLSAADETELKREAAAYLTEVANGKTLEAIARHDLAMQNAMPEEKLKEAFAQVTTASGPLEKVAPVSVEQKDGYRIVMLDAEHERAFHPVRVVFNSAGKVSGLWFGPPRAKVAAPAELPEGVREISLKTGAEGWIVDGTLTLPSGDGPFPGIVLVHGSGPHDQDETVGPNKPFRDLAHGLAQRGVAVLRYEKRTRAHAKRIAAHLDFTVNAETVDDAVAAAEQLKRDPRVKPDAVFVLGHSLGGMVAPRIAERAPWLAGVVILAGNTRPAEDLVVEQLEYIKSLKDSPLSAAEIDEMKKQAQQVKALTPDSPNVRDTFLFGVPASYWLDLRAYDPATQLAAFKGRIFIGQGGRDYQVTTKDLDGWKRGLEKRSDVTFKLYDKLNHLFLEGEGPSTPKEYEREGHIPVYVVDDIAAFIVGPAK